MHLLAPAASTPEDIDDFIAWAQDHGNLTTVPSTGSQNMYLSGNGVALRAVGLILLVRSSWQTFDCDIPAVDSVGDSWWKAASWRLHDSHGKLDRSLVPAAFAFSSHQENKKLWKD